MTISEKAAYLKGLMDGLNLDMDAVYKIIRGEDVPCGRWDND